MRGAGAEKCLQWGLSNASTELCTGVCHPIVTTKRNGVCPRGPNDLLMAIYSEDSKNYAAFVFQLVPQHIALATAFPAVYLHRFLVHHNLSNIAPGTFLSFSFARSCIYK